MNLAKFKPLYLVLNEDGNIEGTGKTQQDAFIMAQASYYLNHIENCADCECGIDPVDTLLSLGYTIKKVYYIPEDGL